VRRRWNEAGIWSSTIRIPHSEIQNRFDPTGTLRGVIPSRRRLPRKSFQER
jgi:hypothetical protein